MKNLKRLLVPLLLCVFLRLALQLRSFFDLPFMSNNDTLLAFSLVSFAIMFIQNLYLDVDHY